MPLADFIFAQAEVELSVELRCVPPTVTGPLTLVLLLRCLPDLAHM